ncbi:MAG: hypothetical protein INR69_14375 [Mucilaginibacter polytrichastri]|nr:hypothetical protein [Mucilaginibacter polytrichastri]
MAKVATEQDVVAFLKEKVDSLKQELQKAEDGLAFFTGTASPAAPVKKRGPKAKTTGETVKPAATRRGRKKKSTQETGTAVNEVPEKATRKTRAKRAVKSLSIPEAYADSLTRDAKIAYALQSIQSGNAEDITAKLLELEPGQEQGKLHRLVTQRLSALAIKGQLKSEKVGRKSTYSLA